MPTQKDYNSISDSYLILLQTARELFAEHGFHNTTIRMISKQANVNVAAVNYYFRTKENLYFEVFQDAFKSLYASFEDTVHEVSNDTTWREAIDKWLSFVLTLFLSDDPQYSLVRQIVAHERSTPSQLCRNLYDEFFIPVVNTLRDLLMMATHDLNGVEFRAFYLSILGQCTSYINRASPWDEFLIEKSIPRNEWIEIIKEQIKQNIFARCSYKPKNTN